LQKIHSLCVLVSHHCDYNIGYRNIGFYR